MEEDKQIMADEHRKHSLRADTYLRATVLGAIIGFGALFGISDKTLRYSLAGSMAVATGITAELHSRSLKKRDYYRARMSGLEPSLPEKDEKVIIWSSFVDNITTLKNRYKKYNSLTIYGKMTIDERNKSIKWFQEDPDYKVLIANPAAAKEGLTLTAANNAIYLDRTFNLVDYLQSQDRIHRISQKKECNIFIIIAKDTVDEYVDELLTKKNEIAKLIQGDIDHITFPQDLLTKEKLLSILGEFGK